MEDAKKLARGATKGWLQHKTNIKLCEWVVTDRLFSKMSAEQVVTVPPGKHIFFLTAERLASILDPEGEYLAQYCVSERNFAPAKSGGPSAPFESCQPTAPPPPLEPLLAAGLGRV